jgi:hypothetical protein
MKAMVAIKKWVWDFSTARAHCRKNARSANDTRLYEGVFWRHGAGKKMRRRLHAGA